MAPKPKTVTAKALQGLLTRIGSTSSGTKATLQERFLRDVSKSDFLIRSPISDGSRPATRARKLRIVSIDMGIKNLAFCDAEVQYPSKSNLNATMEVFRWEKIDLVKSTLDLRRHLPSPEDIEKGTPEEDSDVDPYSLSVLSATAYRLIRDTILVGEPDVVLIEKQRWRSGNGSAVLQWTVRVNTLEGMLWAVLETLKSERKVLLPRLRDGDARRDYEVYGVDPKRVAYYWLGEIARAREERGKKDVISKAVKAVEQETGTKRLSRGKAEKQAKIAVLRSWLSEDPPSTASTTSAATPKISFKIGAHAEAARQALGSPTKLTGRRKKSNSSDEIEPLTAGVSDSEIKKLDDITDCFLQAAAWVSWESNRLQLQGVRNARREDDGSMVELSEEVLRDMVDLVDGE